MDNRRYRFLRLVIAAGVAVISVLALIFPGVIPQQVNHAFYLLLGAAVVIALVPLERLTSLKIGELELLLAQPQVRGAISALGLSSVRSRELRDALMRDREDVVAARGSRILWIDDYPHKLVSLRRLIRSLGVQVVTATSSTEALALLEEDNDYDLIITDVQRTDFPGREAGAEPLHDGVNLIVYLRSLNPDPVIRNLRVLFYAAYPERELALWTKPAREIPPGAETARTSVDVVTKAFQMLASSRAAPIITPAEKEPTVPRDQEGNATSTARE